MVRVKGMTRRGTGAGPARAWRSTILAAGVTLALLAGGALPSAAASRATIEGVVKDANGKPVAGATVYVLSPDRGPGVKKKTRKATTNSKGRYRVKTSPAGWYQVKASVDLGGPCKIKTGPRKPVKVKHGKKRTVNLKLPRLIETTYRPVDQDGELVPAGPDAGCFKRTTVDGEQVYRTYLKASAKSSKFRWPSTARQTIVNEGRTYWIEPGKVYSRVPLDLPKKGKADLGEIVSPRMKGTATVRGALDIRGVGAANLALVAQPGGLDPLRWTTWVNEDDDDQNFAFPEVADGKYLLEVSGTAVSVPVTVKNGAPVDLGTIKVDLSSEIKVVATVSTKVARQGWCIVVDSKIFSDPDAAYGIDSRGRCAGEDPDDPDAPNTTGRVRETLDQFAPGTYTVSVGRPTDKVWSKSVKVRITKSGQSVFAKLPKLRIDGFDRTVRGKVKNVSSKPPARYAHLLRTDGVEIDRVRVRSNGTFTFKKVSHRGGRVEIRNAFNPKNQWSGDKQVVAKVKIPAGTKNVRLKTVKVR